MRAFSKYLAMFDVAGNQERLLCPASQASVEGERVVFLRPEKNGSCAPQPLLRDVQLNGDTDFDDEVVQRWKIGDRAVTNLHCAGSRVVLGTDWLAALVSEADQGGTDLNGDGDTDDLVLAWGILDGVTGLLSGGSLTNSEMAMDFVAAMSTRSAID